ncbi:hypothetical protein BH10ACI1_BH10ACI1_21820 [soil metagenome]
MKNRLLFILCFAFCIGSPAFGQTKTITNADLEKFRQKRLQAEREYLENYERLGLPSPAQIEKEREESNRERRELAQRLEQEQIQREAYSQPQPLYVIQSVTVNQARSNYPYYYNYLPYGFTYFQFRRSNLQNQGTKTLIIRPPRPIRPPIFMQTNPRF